MVEHRTGMSLTSVRFSGAARHFSPRVSFQCRLSHDVRTPPTQVRFLRAARDFSPRVNFQCRLSYGVCTPLCAIGCVYICAHVKYLVVHVRVRWIMETLTHPACTVGWVARLCRKWLSRGKGTRISHGRNPIGTIQL